MLQKSATEVDDPRPNLVTRRNELKVVLPLCDMAKNQECTNLNLYYRFYTA